MRFLLCFFAVFSLFGKEEINQICDQYKRPFSILNLNAGDGELGIKLAKKYPHSVVVMTEQDIGIDKKLATALLKRIKDEQVGRNIVLLSGQINVNDAQSLAKCEHFDIVICSKSPYEMQLPKTVLPNDIIDLLKEIACHVFIEDKLIESSEKPFIEKSLLFRDLCMKTRFTQSFSKMNRNVTCEKLNSTLAITKCPGISLIAFQAYRGLWPERTTLLAALSEKTTRQNFTLASLWNVIVSGEIIHIESFPNREEEYNDPLCPSLWEIQEEFFECTSKREIRSLVESNYFD